MSVRSFEPMMRAAAGLKPQSPQKVVGPMKPTTAVVKAVNSDGTLTLNIAGDTTNVPGDCLADNIIVAVNDTVEVLVIGSRALVLGTLRTAPTEWQTLGLTGHWANFGSPWRTAQYRILSKQVVFRGVVANANAGGTNEGIAFLPVSASGDDICITAGNIAGGGDQAVRVTVDSVNNEIYIGSAPSNPANPVTYLDLSGVSYWTD